MSPILNDFLGFTFMRIFNVVAKKSVRYSRLLVVTELDVSGAHCMYMFN